MNRTSRITVVTILLLGIVSTTWIFKNSPERVTSSLSSQVSIRKERLWNILQCVFDDHLDIEFEDKAKEVAYFIHSKLVESFNDYGVNEDLEKIHFLSQTMAETGDFIYMFEKGRPQMWKDTIRNERFPKGDCRSYLSLAQDEKGYFDAIQRRQRYPYMAAFRGRGLHHLTLCVNYLGFFYHKAAKRISDGRSSQMRTYFHHKNGDIKLNTICDSNIIRSVSSQVFANTGLPPLSEDIIRDIESVVNPLSLPCYNVFVRRFIHKNYQCPRNIQLSCNNNPSFREMDNLEFIVDSALWHWRKCQYPTPFGDHLKGDSVYDVGEIASCIHGTDVYQTYNDSSCNNDTGRGTLGSYCRRLKRFRILQDCFTKHPR